MKKVKKSTSSALLQCPGQLLFNLEAQILKEGNFHMVRVFLVT